MIIIITPFLFIFHYGIHLFCNRYILQYKKLSNHKLISKKQHFICQDIIGICMSFIICLLFLIELINYNNIFDVNERWSLKISFTTFLSFSLFISTLLYELVLYLIFGKKIHFYIHHIIVCFIYSLSLYLQELSFFLCLCGFVEITNLFLCSTTILSRLQLQKKYKIQYQFLGICLYLNYFLIRIMMFFLSFMLFILDLFYYPTIIMTHHSVYLSVVSISFFILYAMSFYWFLIIHNKVKNLIKHYFIQFFNKLKIT